MSTKTHQVVAGDTFESLSSRYFGEPSQAIRIRQANPGTTAGLIPGTTAVIPTVQQLRQQTSEPRPLTVHIGGIAFQHVSEWTITRTLDAVDTAELTSPLADTPEFRELIQPFSFPSMDISEDGIRVFTGTMIDVSPSVSDQGSIVHIGGYSTPGVLGDCTLPPSSFPLQFRNVNIGDIAESMIKPFGLSLERVGDMGGTFRRVKMKRDRKIWQFLANLAQQRQLLLRSNAFGQLVIAEPPEVDAPVATLSEDEPPLKSVKPAFSPQNYHSHVTGIRSTRRGLNGTQHTVPNALAVELGIFRPLIVSVKDTSKGELPKAAQAIAGRMLANAISYTVNVAGWRDANGVIWNPGDTVELFAPSAFVTTPFKFQIRSVRLSRTVLEGTTADLSLVLPGAFGGTPPDMLPWQ